MDIQRLLNGFLGSVDGSGSIGEAAQKLKTGGVPGGLLGGAAAGGLIATLVSSKKARKFGGKALTYGGLAVLGGLAYKAWNDHKANAPQGSSQVGPEAVAPAPAGSRFDPAALTDQSGRDFRLTLIKEMISGALADGHVDQQEHQMIREQVDQAGLDADEKTFLFDQLSKPSDPIAIANLTSARSKRPKSIWPRCWFLMMPSPKIGAILNGLEMLCVCLRICVNVWKPMPSKHFKLEEEVEVEVVVPSDWRRAARGAIAP